MARQRVEEDLVHAVRRNSADLGRDGRQVLERQWTVPVEEPARAGEELAVDGDGSA